MNKNRIHLFLNFFRQLSFTCNGFPQFFIKSTGKFLKAKEHQAQIREKWTEKRFKENKNVTG